MLLWPYLYPHFRNLRRQTRLGIKWYTRTLIKFPLSARAITAGLLFTCADISAQLLASDTYTLMRTVRFGMYGFGFMGPFLHVWYMFMHEHAPGDTFWGSLVKALFEQVTLEPMCISCFLIYDSILNRKTLPEIKARFKASFWILWQRNACFWIPGNFMNYYLASPDFRVMFANCCSFWWNVYLYVGTVFFSVCLFSSLMYWLFHANRNALFLNVCKKTLAPWWSLKRRSHLWIVVIASKYLFSVN